MENSKIVWAILDNRAGNRNQVKGVLTALDVKYIEINIEYNFLSFLPNFFFQIFYNTIHVKSFRKIIKAPKPDIIISCGRRTATIALAIKKYFNFKPFCIHLMYPRFTLFRKNFNLIFTPEHDKVKESNKVKKILGSPSNIKLQKKNNKFIKPVIALIIGGDHGYYKLSEQIVDNIIDFIKLKFSQKVTLFITTSRRTSNLIIKKIDQLAINNLFIKEVYHPNKSKDKNPYLRYLNIANEIIVTGDSMSMISDACETGKPVRIYYNKSFCSHKHINFCQSIIKKNFAFSFETLGDKCHIIKKLETSNQIATIIKNEIYLWKK